MEPEGEIPAGAGAAADALIRRFGRAAEPPISSAPADAGGWPERLAARHPGSGASVAIRYAPDADAFFRGEDPLAILAQLPGLIAVEVLDAGGVPALEDLDPFTCHLVFGALASCSPDAAAAALGAVIGQVETWPVEAARPESGASLSLAARGLLEAQILLLGETRSEGLSGRLASARRVSVNVLRHAGRRAEAERLQALTSESLAGVDPVPLITAIRAVLSGSLGGPATAPEPPGAATPETAARTLRVDVERIDALVDLTGELLVAKNALGHAALLAQAGGEVEHLAGLLKDQHGALGRLVAELQRSVLNIRVLPMRYVFQRFPRLVREMVVSLGKPAHLVTEGDDTEADKVIVEALFETPPPRCCATLWTTAWSRWPTAPRAGKPASATIRLSAGRQGEHVVVEVSDDGGGVDTDRVRTVAEQRGVASGEALAAMDEQEIVDLVFAPGFSTAAEVTSLSGRGVGMDAVRIAVERLGGRVAIRSTPRQGTRVRFTLPFAVMISRVLTVETGGQMFGIPLDAVLETVRVDRDRLKPVGGARAFVLRNRTVPVIDLAAALGERAHPAAEGQANIVVAAVGGQLAGLEVDRLGERLDVMLKPMDGLLSGMPGVAGTTLLGDGRVLIVLDVQALLQ